jgi:tRNA C32,U32 (ribose-2'-O)-methylase TrmJ
MPVVLSKAKDNHIQLHTYEMMNAPISMQQLGRTRLAAHNDSTLRLIRHNRIHHSRPAYACDASSFAAAAKGRRMAVAARAAAAAAAAAPVHNAAAAAAADTAAAAATPMLLADVRVVLVAPKTPSNIGAAARACANFEAPRLVIVAPRCDPRAGEAYKIACGESVLERMTVVDTLADALADCTGSIGFTRRAGSTRLTHISMAALLAEYPNAVPGAVPGWQPDSGQEQQQQLDEATISSSSSSSSDAFWQGIAAQGATALVFGREESGLTEEELRRCTHACAIPTGRVQPSMNLSHAVATVLAGLFERRLAAAGLEELPGGRECAQGVFLRVCFRWSGYCCA